EPGDPVDENIYHLTPHRRQQLGIVELPGSLKEALEELRSDNEFLRPVFSSSLLEAYQDIKAQEWKEESIRPTPFEYYQYFDV
ncbi:MAG: type I glutamate--ammonia ligase, partial [Thermoprotei archaeon]